MARSTGYTAANPPAIRSAATAPLVSIPYRSSSDWASACAYIVASRVCGGSSDHRPLTFGGPVRDGVTGRPWTGRPLGWRSLQARARNADGPARRGWPPPRTVRSGPSVSLVSKPAHSRSEIAAATSVSDGAFAIPAAAAR